MPLQLVTGPIVEPVDLLLAKQHLRVTISDDDNYIVGLLTVGRQRGERSTLRAWNTQTWDWYLDSWPTWDGYHGGRVGDAGPTALPPGGRLYLPKPPLQSVTWVKYVALDGTLTTWDPSNYIVDVPSGDNAMRGAIALDFARVWPVIRPVANAVRIRFVCGYGDAPEDVPFILRQAMQMDIGTLYETRSAVLSGNRAASIEIASTTRDIYQMFVVR